MGGDLIPLLMGELNKKGIINCVNGSTAAQDRSLTLVSYLKSVAKYAFDPHLNQV